jgi:hypothetical protein
MASAVISIISKTVDVLMKIRSTESKKQPWGHLIFGVYQSLGEIDHTLGGILTWMTDNYDGSATELSRDIDEAVGANRL